MTESEMKLNAYTSPYWGNKEIMLVTGLANAEASKEKQRIVKAGGCVPNHGQKVYRDVACKILGIDIKQEISLLKLVLEV